MSKALRQLFLVSVPITMLCAIVFIGSLAGENTDFNSAGATFAIVASYAFALIGIVRSSGSNDIRLVKLYFFVWAYAMILFCGVAAFVALTGHKPFWTP